MIKYFLLLTIFFCFCSVEAQQGLWPIEGKSAGEGILYKPQDHIGDELNFDNLFITAEEKTNTANKPFTQTIERMVLKKDNYDFFKNTTNLSSQNTNMFPDYKRGTIVGQETGSAYHRLNATKFANVFMNNTVIELYMPLIKSTFAEKEDSDIPWGRGVIPDKKVQSTFDDLIGDNDIALNQTIEMIKQKPNEIDNSDMSIFLYILGFLIAIFSIIKLKHLLNKN